MYEFHQLSNEAKQLARDWYMQGRGGRMSCRYVFVDLNSEIDENLDGWKFNADGTIADE